MPTEQSKRPFNFLFLTQDQEKLRKEILGGLLAVSLICFLLPFSLEVFILFLFSSYLDWKASFSLLFDFFSRFSSLLLWPGIFSFFLFFLFLFKKKFSRGEKLLVVILLCLILAASAFLIFLPVFFHDGPIDINVRGVFLTLLWLGLFAGNLFCVKRYFKMSPD